MKFKIIERNDGKFDVYKKSSFFMPWKDSMWGPFPSYERAKEWVDQRLQTIKNMKEEEYGRKHKRVVEVISE